MPRLFWVLLILTAGAFLLVRVRRSASDQPAAADKDALTLDHLKSAGSDLSLPHNPEFFLYLPTEAAARSVASRYAGQGFSADVHPAVSGSKWSCVLTKQMVLSAGTLHQLRGEFAEVAAAYGGEYDGWGAEVEN